MNADESHEHLVTAAQSGDRRAFAELVEAHQSALRNFMRRLAREDWHLADELAQDTFIKAYRNLSRLDRPERFRSWLFSIGYRTFLDHRRRAGIGYVSIREDVPEVAAESGETSPGYEELLALLDAPHVAVVDLVYRKGYSHSEAAEVLGMPLGTLKAKIRNALGKLKLQLSERP